MANYNQRKYIAQSKANAVRGLLNTPLWDDLKNLADQYEAAWEAYTKAAPPIGTGDPRVDWMPAPAGLDLQDAKDVMTYEWQALDLLDKYGFVQSKVAGQEYSQAEFIWYHLFTPSGVPGPPGGGSRAW